MNIIYIAIKKFSICRYRFNSDSAHCASYPLTERSNRFNERMVGFPERMIRVEEELKHQLELIRASFDLIEKCFELMMVAMNKRFDLITKRMNRFIVRSFGLTLIPLQPEGL